MWTALAVKHDTNWLRLGERPLAEALADKLNEIEEAHGTITHVIPLVDTEHLVELVIQIESKKLTS